MLDQDQIHVPQALLRVRWARQRGVQAGSEDPLPATIPTIAMATAILGDESPSLPQLTNANLRRGRAGLIAATVTGSSAAVCSVPAAYAGKPRQPRR